MAADAFPGAQQQFPLHGFAQAPGQCQAQPGAAELPGDACAGLGEGLEDALLRVFGDADAGVVDLDAHAAAVERDAQVDASAPRELERVGQQVADHLAYAGRVAEQQGRQLRVDQAGQFDFGRGVLREQAGGFLRQGAEVEGDAFQFQLAGLELGQVENVVEQVDQHLAGVMGDQQLLALFIAQAAVQGQCQHAEQAVERRADLVAHVGQESRAGLGHFQGGTARLLEVAVGLGQAGVGRFQLGGAGRDDVLQLAQVLGQAVLGLAALADFLVDIGQLLVGHRDQDAHFVALVAGGAGHGGEVAARIAVAEGTDHPDQGFGQHGVEQHQQNQ